MSYTPVDIADAARALQEQAERLTEQAAALVLMAENPEPETPVVPVEPDPVAGIAVRVLEVAERDGNRIRIRFGFADNRPGQLLVEAEDGDGWLSAAEASWKYGAEGREHHQWIEITEPGTYSITVWTLIDDHTDWLQADGKPLELVIESPGLRMLQPTSGFVAESPDVGFAWIDENQPNAVYDLHIYADEEYTQKIVGTDGTVFDTQSIRTATAHTFKNDPSDGGQRYGRLWQWPNDQYRLEDRVELRFEYTAYTMPERKSKSGRMNGDTALTSIASDIATALQYEQAFFDSFDKFSANAETMYRSTSAEEWFVRTYSGLSGVRLYHLYDDMASLSKVLKLTRDERPDHAEKYKALAVSMIRENVDIVLNFKGLEGCPDFGDSIFVAATDRWRYLDFTRGCAWLAMLMDAALYVDTELQDEFADYAQKLGAMMGPYLDRAVEPARNAHMTAHPAIASLILGRIGGYLDDVRDDVVTCFRDNIAGRVSPWALTDISHAAQSEAALFAAYELGLRGHSLPELSFIGAELLTELADGAAERMNNNDYSATVSPFTESYGELVKFGDDIAAHAGSPEDYSGSGDTRAWITAAHLAMGFAIDAGESEAFEGEWTPEMSDSSSLQSVLGDAMTYAHDTANRVTVSAGNLMQRFVPTSKGSYHDQGAARIDDGFREYTVEQDVKFAADFDAVKGGKFGFGLGGGTNASGGDDDPAGWTARLMFRPASVSDAVQAVIYSYQSNRQAKLSGGNRWGDDNPIGDLSLGDWHHIKFAVGLNSMAGASDGYLRAYLNGEQVLEVTGIQWQAEGTPGEIMRAIYTAFFGGGDESWAPDSDQYMWIRNVRVSWRNP